MLFPMAKTAMLSVSALGTSEASLLMAMSSAPSQRLAASAKYFKCLLVMSTFFRWFVGWIVRRLKGRAYVIDEKIGGSTLVRVVLDRLVCLVRGLYYRTGLASGGSWFVFVGPGAQIRNPGYLRLGKGVTIGAGCVLNGLSSEGINIGDNVSIGQYSIIEATGVLTDLGKGVSIGAGSGIGAYSFIGAAGGVQIGSNVIMGQRISFHSENHNFDSPDVDIKYQGVTRQGIIVGDNCWIGANVVVLDGTVIGRGCVIAAGSILRGEYPEDMLIAGVPAKVKRSRLAAS